jgi:SLOG cluster4 family
MRILVIGSAPENNEPGFAHACYLIGQELARAGCVVILGSNRYSTADHHVMRGLQSIPGTHKVMLVRPFKDAHTSQAARATQPVPDPQAGQLPPGSLKFEFVPIRGPWGAGRVTQLLRSDAVIAICGAEGTEQAIQLAPEMRRPVVVIPSFGGSAEKAWNSLVRDYSFLGASIGDYYSLADSWKDENAKIAVAMARKLAKKNPYEDRSWKYLMFLSIAVFTLLAAWALIFSYPCGWWIGHSMPTCSNDRPTIFLLFWIAAFIGTGLRAAKRAADDPSERISASDIFVEGAVGLSVSFGLSLIYMAGLFLAAEKSDLFPLLSNTEGDFRRTAVLMSTISFTSAFLLEGSLVKLQERLRERVLDER